MNYDLDRCRYLLLFLGIQLNDCDVEVAGQLSSNLPNNVVRLTIEFEPHLLVVDCFGMEDVVKEAFEAARVR